MKPRMLKFVAIWSLKRGTLYPPEPLSERGNLLANISQLSHELERAKRQLAGGVQEAPERVGKRRRAA